LADTDRIELTSEWDQIKPFIESDPRYKSVERDNQREMLFNRFMKELRRKAEADLIKLFDETKKFTRSMLKNKSELNDIIELLRVRTYTSKRLINHMLSLQFIIHLGR